MQLSTATQVSSCSHFTAMCRMCSLYFQTFTCRVLCLQYLYCDVYTSQLKLDTCIVYSMWCVSQEVEVEGTYVRNNSNDSRQLFLLHSILFYCSTLNQFFLSRCYFGLTGSFVNSSRWLHLLLHPISHLQSTIYSLIHMSIHLTVHQPNPTYTLQSNHPFTHELTHSLTQSPTHSKHALDWKQMASHAVSKCCCMSNDVTRTRPQSLLVTPTIIAVM